MRSMFLALTILLLPIFLVSHATAEEAEPGYASFARTTIMARYADLGPSITFWRDVMGFSYAGDPKPSTGTSSPLGWDENAVRYFTAFTSKEGSTVAVLMVEDAPDFPSVNLPDNGVAYGGVVLVHTAKNIRDVYDRAVANNVDIVKPYGLSTTGRSIKMMFRAPTGQMVEIYEMIQQPDAE